MGIFLWHGAYFRWYIIRQIVKRFGFRQSAQFSHFIVRLKTDVATTLYVVRQQIESRYVGGFTVRRELNDDVGYLKTLKRKYTRFYYADSKT